jgi:long-chain fatty acid transport protein
MKRMFLALAAVALLATPAAATDGHYLHGVGAVNSTMGGAGVAQPKSLLGTFYLNPAGLMAFEGTRMEFSLEMFKADRTVSSTVGPFSGSTRSTSLYTPIPAMGVSYRLNNDKVVVGLGAVGVGGFGVDYPQDNTNPVLGPAPNGFGQVYSNYSYLKIAPSIAWAVTPKLWLGGAVNVNWASLAVVPNPTAAPAASSQTAVYYSDAAAASSAFGLGFQLGAMYKINDVIALGASYTSNQAFEEFEWNSVYKNPNLPNFGQARVDKFQLDAPAVIAGGLGLNPLPGLSLAADVKYITYSSTEGFEKSGFDQTGKVLGFGWEDIMVFAVGGEYWVTEGFALRAGYNHSENPIPDEQSFFNIPAPAIVQDHFTFGIGLKPSRRSEISLGYYIVPENTQSGPIPNPAVPPGSSVTNSMKESSLLIQFTVWGK